MSLLLTLIMIRPIGLPVSRGLEFEPERGARCSACFDVRFERTALYAHEHGFKIITSSLGISRWKDMDQVNRSGIKAAGHFEGMVYWTYNWRKNGGSARMYEISKREGFYQQEYCGCVYSLRDTNLHRIRKGEVIHAANHQVRLPSLPEGLSSISKGWFW